MSTHDPDSAVPQKGRRHFMAAAAGVGAAVAGLLGPAPASAEAGAASVAPTEPPGGGGYPGTQKINKYYRCARYW